jgi:four helix bundle protein
MTYEEWELSVPPEITGDPLWNMEVYRWSLFAADIAWTDVTKLAADRRTVQLASQLVDAVGSIGANISEGYSRQSGKDQARFYEYALGSARESRTWYFDARHVLGNKVATHRMQLLTKIIKYLLKTIPAQRGYKLHDDAAPYGEDMPLPAAEVPMPE